MTEQNESLEMLKCPLNIDKKAIATLFETYGSVTAFEQIHMKFMKLFINREIDESFSFLLDCYPKNLIVSLVANAIQMQKILMEALQKEIDTPTEH